MNIFQIWNNKDRSSNMENFNKTWSMKRDKGEALLE